MDGLEGTSAVNTAAKLTEKITELENVTVIALRKIGATAPQIAKVKQLFAAAEHLVNLIAKLNTVPVGTQKVNSVKSNPNIITNQLGSVTNYRASGDYETGNLSMTVNIAVLNESDLPASDVNGIISQFNADSYSGPATFSGPDIYRPDGTNRVPIYKNGTAKGPVPNTTVDGSVSVDFKARLVQSITDVQPYEKLLFYTKKKLLYYGVPGAQGYTYGSASAVSTISVVNIYQTSKHEIVHTLGLGDLSTGDLLMNPQSNSMKIDTKGLGEILLNAWDNMGRIKKFGIGNVFNPSADYNYIKDFKLAK